MKADMNKSKSMIPLHGGNQKLNAATNVRLTPELRARLQRAAERSGLKAADLIRMAVEEFLDKVEEAGEMRIPLHAAKRGNDTSLTI